jgi:hypothetical protein
MRSEKTTTVALIVALDPTSIADTCFRSPEHQTPDDGPLAAFAG